MNNDTLKRLQSSDPNKRLTAWFDIVEELIARGELRPREAKTLHDLLREEDDDDVHRFATTSLMGFILSALANANQVDESMLDAWVSHFFHRRSALFSTKEPDYRTRDPLALAYLARRFPEWLYENTDLQPLPLDDDRLGLESTIWLKSLERQDCPFCKRSTQPLGSGMDAFRPTG